jgi:O-antigen ligase
MSFWTGARLEQAWHLLDLRINQAHNGYLEQYLNLGYVGLFFIAVIILTGYSRVYRHLHTDPPAAILRLCLISVAALYNYTEAAFYGLNNMWILLLLACIELPRHQPEEARARRPISTRQPAYRAPSARQLALKGRAPARSAGSRTSQRVGRLR